jgi:hypothetical protein
MQTEILDSGPDSAGANIMASPQSAEEQSRTDRNEEVLAAIQQNLLRLREAFAQLDVCKTAEEQLADEVHKAEAEENRILKDEELSVLVATKKVVEARARHDVLIARHTAARQRTTIQIEDVLEFGRIVRRNCVHLGAALLQARRTRLLQFMDGFLGPAIDHGLPITTVALVEASRPYKEFLYFTNSVHMEPRKDSNEELSELKTAPDRWLGKLKTFVASEPDLDLSSVFLGKD